MFSSSMKTTLSPSTGAVFKLSANCPPTASLIAPRKPHGTVKSRMCPCVQQPLPVRVGGGGQQQALPLSSLRNLLPVCRALGGSEPSSSGSGEGRSNELSEFVEVKVESVRVTSGTQFSVVYLRILDGRDLVLPVHIGEVESAALLKEINHQRQPRPLTHDVAKNLLLATGYQVTKIRITDVISNTYYARIHLARYSSSGVIEGEEVDVDARPSDAINLALRFGAPMYVNKRIAESAGTNNSDAFTVVGSESNSDILRSVRETLATFEDPCIMLQLQKDLAIIDQRFEDAHALQQSIYHEMTHNSLLRLVVAMEAAVSDGRYDEAARLRDEFKRVAQLQMSSERSSRL